MTEEIVKLFAEHQQLVLQSTTVQARMRTVRREISEKLDNEGYGLLVVPTFRDWKSSPRWSW